MLAEAARVAASTVVNALQKASAATGVDFNYLLGTAMRESGLKPAAQSQASSAAGLFQFVEQTWLGLVKDHGAKYGLGSFANAISKSDNGRLRVGNADDRAAILRLRNDPQISALMAGEYTKQAANQMEESLGRKVSSGELYAAHLLGAGSACKLIRSSQAAPGQAAADLFPQAAEANPSIFYHSNGSPKSVREVYNWTCKPASTSFTPTAKLDVQSVDRPTGPNISTAALDSGNAAAMLASLWQPKKGFFSTEETSTNAPPFAMTPAILDVLQTVAKDRSKK